MNEINEMLKKQLEHRTIREFKETSIPKEILDKILEVARRTATSNGMQQFSIVRVTDDSIKKEMAEICRQEYVARIPELLIFVADQYRNFKIAEGKSCSNNLAGDMDHFFQAFTDACIAAQNVVNAAEALDLGTMYLGSIHNDLGEICRILNLPELTLPVIGVGIGYPNQNPQLKPRLDNGLRVFENSYTCFDNYLDEIKDYDEEMQTYYDLRNVNRRVDSFSDQVASKYASAVAKRQEILNIIHKQGFNDKQ